MFTIIISAIIILVAICATLAEKKANWRRKKFNGTQFFFTTFSIITAVGASAMSIAAEHNIVNFKWQAILLAIVIVIIGVILTLIFGNKQFYDREVETVYPIVSTDINLFVFAAASIVAWLW